MNRREFLQSSALAGSSAAAQQNPNGRLDVPPSGRPAERPNVIWVFGDQHRMQALGCNGDPNARTPNIDNLAVDGMTYSNAVSGFPLCCPFADPSDEPLSASVCARATNMLLPDRSEDDRSCFR